MNDAIELQLHLEKTFVGATICPCLRCAAHTPMRAVEQKHTRTRKTGIRIATWSVNQNPPHFG